jgi:hypothetical protein
MKEKKHNILIFFLTCIALLVAVFSALTYHKPRSAPVIHQSKITSANHADHREVKGLIGTWVRRDGGYVLEIFEINKDGTLNTAYYNPNAIHVAEARVKDDEKHTSIFIKLQDKGYPGSTYDLQYDFNHDVLDGYYFHPGLNRTLRVVFKRIQTSYNQQ